MIGANNAGRPCREGCLLLGHARCGLFLCTIDEYRSRAWQKDSLTQSTKRMAALLLEALSNLGICCRF